MPAVPLCPGTGRTVGAWGLCCYPARTGAGCKQLGSGFAATSGVASLAVLKSLLGLAL